MAKKKKEAFNTTIDSETLDNFRMYCKSIGVSMNLVLETFMVQFADGQFVFKLGKTKNELDLDEE